jgi:hypothetical protein
LPEVKELNVYQVDVYDPADEPCGDRYLIYVHFDPGAQRGYSTETEFNLAGSWIAERLIRLDESESPGIISRLGFSANRVTIDVDSLKEDHTLQGQVSRSGLDFRLGGVAFEIEALYSFRS